MAASMTLRDALARHKPFIECNPKKNTGNTKGPTWPQPKTYHLWDAFTIENLNESYGHILDAEVPSHLAERLPPVQKLDGLEITDDLGPNKLIEWTDGTVLPLVKLAKQSMQLHGGASVIHKCSSADKNNIAQIPGAKKTKIDHIIELGNPTRDILVVGLGRMSAKWRGSVLVKSMGRPKKARQVREVVWPIRQLANLCMLANTRYGYIQTDEELVVCCFGAVALADEEGWDDWTVQVMPVPWNMELTVGPRVLTTELALWWLCMLSLSKDEHYKLIPFPEITPIDSWDTTHLGDERGWVRRHRYSGREEPTDEPPPPAYETPEPDNPAAFAAGVGINNEDLFGPDYHAMNLPVDQFGVPDLANDELFFDMINPEALVGVDNLHASPIPVGDNSQV